MSEQPTVPGAEAIANKQAEQPTAPREQAAASDSQVPTEDFEAGVLAQLDSLYRTALRLTNNQQEAEDLVQETMLKAFRFANTYQRGTNLRAWLFRILNTSAINRYRKQASHPQATSLPEGEEFYLYNRIRDFSGQELSAGAEEEVLSRCGRVANSHRYGDEPHIARTAPVAKIPLAVRASERLSQSAILMLHPLHLLLWWWLQGLLAL